jgi:hypothetical protein
VLEGKRQRRDVSIMKEEDAYVWSHDQGMVSLLEAGKDLQMASPL